MVKGLEMLKFKNVAFLSTSDALRTDLHRLGLTFFLVKIMGQSQFMIVTDQLRLIQDLSSKHKIVEFFLSDSRRQIFKIFSDNEYGIFFPEKLGILSKTKELKKDSFLTVTEDNTTCNYIVV
jgi:hypothetical protein